MNIGARILKTGISVGLAIFISQLLNLESGVFSAISAFIAIQPSVYRSWQYLGEQFKANTIGVLLALTGFVAFGNNPVVIGMVVIISLLVSIKLKLKSTSINLGAITVIAIMAVEHADFFALAGNRFLSIFIGVMSAIIINVIFLPPKYEDKLLHHVEKTSEQISILLRTFLQEELEIKAYKESKKIMMENINKANELFDYYKDEFHKPLNQAKYAEAKKLVIYKRMINLLKKEKDLIETIEIHQTQIKKLPSDVQEKIKQQLHHITTYDVKLYMKFEEKIKSNSSSNTKLVMLQNNDELKRILYNCNETHFLTKEFDFNIFLLADMLEVATELVRLDTLISNLKKKSKTS